MSRERERYPKSENRDEVSRLFPRNVLPRGINIPDLQRISRAVPRMFPNFQNNSKAEDRGKNNVWYTQGSSSWGRTKNEGLDGRKTIIDSKMKGKGLKVGSEIEEKKKNRKKVEYKEFDLFKSPDLPEITSRLVTPGQGLQKSVYVILLLSAAGFVFQAWSVLQQYFSYDTVTVLSIIMPDKLIAPAVSICFPYPEIVDQKKALQRYPQLDGQTFLVSTLGNFLTIKDIFELTPKADVDVTIASCAFRTPESPQLFETTMCDGIMSMNKFFKQQFACYDISLVTKSGFRYRNIRNSLSSAGKFV